MPPLQQYNFYSNIPIKAIILIVFDMSCATLAAT